jgi:predicted ribosome quality control (RQC) complex YloA/Tae2 family protein
MNETLPPLAERVRAETAEARRALTTERKKLARLLEKLPTDAAACEGGEALRLAGEVLKVSLDQVPRGADRVTLAVPWLDGETVEVPLQRDLSPQGNMAKLFRRARGLTLGLKIVREREAQTQARLVQVAAQVAALEAIVAAAEAYDAQQPQALRPRDVIKLVAAWLVTVRQLGVRLQAPIKPDQQVQKVAKGKELPAGVRLFRSPLQAVVLAGKTAEGNDALVTRLLRGRDVWLHLRDRPGAHVMLRVEGMTAAKEAEVAACAMLAGHLSGVAKGEACDVTVCAGKDVRKVKGAPAGSVYVSHERVVRVVVDAAIVDGFYARNR